MIILNQLYLIFSREKTIKLKESYMANDTGVTLGGNTNKKKATTAAPAGELLDTSNEGENLFDTADTNTFVGSDIYSMFGTDSYGLASKITTAANDIMKNKNVNGKASAVNISGSTIFSGVLLQVTLDKVTYSQALIIDERPLKSVKQLLEDDKMAGGGTILFATALLNDKNKKYLESFDLLSKGTVALDPLVVVAETITDDKVTGLVRDLFMRIEAKPFSKVKQYIDRDKGLDLVGNFNTDGQKVVITVTQKDKQASMADMIVGASGPVLAVSARVDTLLSHKQILVAGVQERPFALRPVYFIDAYNKPKTVASHNLEYGLMAVAAASIGLDKDKYITALMPTVKHKNNIGALNTIFNVVKEAQGKPINLLDPKADLKVKARFIDDITTSPSIGIDIEYKVTPNALNVFGTINDLHASADAKKQAGIMIQNAFKNITGVEITGNITEQVIQYPSGIIIDKSGNQMELKDVDAIWLASLGFDGAIDLAREWLVSHTNFKNGYVTKLEILNKLMAVAGLEIKPRGVGYKIVLHTDFLAALLQHANFVITSPSILELPGDDMTGFANIGIELSVPTHISGIGRNPVYGGTQGLRIIG
jgi:hypothetical protein